MLKDELEQLLKLFREGAEGKLSSLEEVFARSLDFFNHLKEQMQTGTPEEKQEAAKMMGEVYTQMMKATQEITEKSGLSEDQLLAFAENPANFTPDQWKAIQESRQKISQAGQDLAKVIAKQGTPASQEEGGKPAKEGKPPKKPHWKGFKA
jgi:hypothetical protein